MKKRAYKEKNIPKKLNFLIFCLFFSLGATVVASEYRDYDFEQDRMILTPDSIILASSFDSVDGIVAYTYYGIQLWKLYLDSKIISWKWVNDLLFIFSKDKNEAHKTNLICIDRHRGQVLWKKP